MKQKIHYYQSIVNIVSSKKRGGGIESSEQKMLLLEKCLYVPKGKHSEPTAWKFKQTNTLPMLEVSSMLADFTKTSVYGRNITMAKIRSDM